MACDFKCGFDRDDPLRLARLRRLLAAREIHSRDSFIDAQLDTVSPAARALLPLVGANLWFTGEPAAPGTPERQRQDALAKLGARRFLLGPLAGILSGFMPGLNVPILHAGGMVGGAAPSRMVSAMAFGNAPRMHSGGWAGLRPDEVPAILQRGERVLSRREAAGYGQAGGSTVNVTINARDAESFRQSRTQIAADIARAVSLGRRGL